MQVNMDLSARSLDLLQRRGVSGEQIEDFTSLLSDAQQALKDGASAREVLNAMSKDELSLLQKTSSLAEPINVSEISDEGATNLLAHPDRTGMVDLNNDGIVEVGKAQTISFPPVNAPQHVKDAWEEATVNMTEGEEMMLQLSMHIQTYGINIEGAASKPALSPEQQWSTEGWQKLMKEARSALEFSVGMDGWTRMNVVKNDFYNRFEQALSAASIDTGGDKQVA